MLEKSIVLLSGGLDSTVNLYRAKQVTEVALTLTFAYGQRAESSEISAAQRIADELKVPHRVIKLDFFPNLGTSSLLNTARSVPTGKDVRIDHLGTSLETARSVWVPNRNGIFLNIAAGFAEAMGASLVIAGFNAEEAKTFPDNSVEYLQALTRAFLFSTSNGVKAWSYTGQMDKPQIVRTGIEMGVDFVLCWPCYFSGVEWCGECESCQRARRAFSEAGKEFSQLRFKSEGVLR